jgi:hypothetical protein
MDIPMMAERKEALTLFIAIHARVPSIVEIIAAKRASTRVLYKDSIMAEFLNRATYHFTVNHPIPPLILNY